MAWYCESCNRKNDDERTNCRSCETVRDPYEVALITLGAEDVPASKTVGYGAWGRSRNLRVSATRYMLRNDWTSDLRQGQKPGRSDL